jgi:hypothetical protein
VSTRSDEDELSDAVGKKKIEIAKSDDWIEKKLSAVVVSAPVGKEIDVVVVRSENEVRFFWIGDAGFRDVKR